MPRKNLYSWIRVDNTEKVDLIVLFLQDSRIVLPIPKKQDHLRMNVAPDQTIMLDLFRSQIIEFNRSIGTWSEKKRAYVGKIPMWQTPSPLPPSLGSFTFFTVFFNIFFAIL